MNARTLSRLPHPGRPPLRPTTSLGWWAVALFGAFTVLNFSWRLLGPAGAYPSFLFGIAAGVVALIAMLRRHERSLAVLASVVLVLLFVAAELLVGHE
jgi:hypothetical protein